MNSLKTLTWLPLTWILLGGTDDPQTLVRRGNEAFMREDYQGALEWYNRAEERTTDPGLVAFNEGAALYRLGRFREAQLHYRRSLEGAQGYRRPRLLFDLGNATLQQARARDVKLLQSAIRCYEDCLSEPQAAPDLKADARHNLAYAKALLARAKIGRSERPDQDNQQDQLPDRENPFGSTADTEMQSGSPRGAATVGQESAEGSQDSARAATAPPPPGVGNLPPIPDQEKLTPLSPEDTAAYLRDIAERVLRERREHRQRALAQPSSRLKDW
jgi:tetratricopeptide (TPR) repeat protein